MNKPLEEYIILTSKESMGVLIVKLFAETYDFLRENFDAKFRIIDYNAKPTVLSKSAFLERYFKETQDQAKLFELVDILFPRYSNATYFLSQVETELKLVDLYKKYQQITNKHL